MIYILFLVSILLITVLAVVIKKLQRQKLENSIARQKLKEADKTVKKIEQIRNDLIERDRLVNQLDSQIEELKGEQDRLWNLNKKEEETIENLRKNIEIKTEENKNLTKEKSELWKRIQDLDLEISKSKSPLTREIIRLPHLPSTLDSVLEYRRFFDWIDSEPRVNHRVESWLNRQEELRAFVEISNDGNTYLNALGILLYDAVKRVQDDRPRVRWPKPFAFPSSTKNCVSRVEHSRPRGWQQFVEKLCNIDCVKSVVYDEAAYGGSIIKVIDARQGTLALRYGSADLWLPLRIETTARGEEEINLVVEYIRLHIM